MRGTQSQETEFKLDDIVLVSDLKITSSKADTMGWQRLVLFMPKSPALQYKPHSGKTKRRCPR